MSVKPRKIIRAQDLPAFCGLKKTAIEEMIKLGLMPAPIRIGKRSRGFLLDEIIAWQNERIAERDGKAKTVEGNSDA